MIANEKETQTSRPSPIPNPKRVLCYAPYNLWALHGLWEVTILQALRFRGANVHYVLCDGLYSECDVFWAATNPRHAMSCIQCQASVANLANGMKMPFVWLGRYVLPNDFREARQWAEGLAADDFLKATYRGWHIAEWVKSSVHSHFRISELDFRHPQIKTTFRSYLYSGLIACLGIDRLLDDYKPDALFLFNGRQSSTRVAFELARRKGIRVICHERGNLKESLKLTENASAVSLLPIEQVWQYWEDIPLTSVELEQISEYMYGRQFGKNLNWRSFSPEPQDTDNVRNNLGLDQSRPLFVLFSSSDDELIAHKEWQGPFSKQMDWIRRTVNFAKRHPALDLVIRVHPNIAGKKATGNNIQQLREFEDLQPDLPRNVRLVMPEDPISSYSLINLANLGLVYMSTVGLEMACKGKNVIVAGGGWLYDKPFVRTVPSADAYEEMLEAFLQVPPQDQRLDIMRMAYRYAYAVFFRLSIPFPLVKMPEPHTGKLAYHSDDALLAGKEPNLDRITRILLENEPVILPPTQAEKDRSGLDEEKWLRHHIDRDSRFAPRELSKPTVSVIIPCYNYGGYLDACVKSVVAQTYQDFEILIVNDGSTDNTKEVAERLIASYPGHRIKLINQPNSGQPAISRNRGISEGQGQYILCLDADDTILPEMLQECVQLLETRADISIAYTDQRYFNEAQSQIVQTREYDFRHLVQANFIGCCSLFRRQAWEEVGGFRTNVKGYEDWDFWIACGERGHSGKRIPRPLFCYRQQTGGLYTTAVKRDRELKAQIVLNHSHLYDRDTVIAARRLIQDGGFAPRRLEKGATGKDKIVAIIAAYNEGDVIFHVIGDLIANGVEVYLIDNSSTDNTIAEASKWLGKGLNHIERFPEDSGYPERSVREYVWRDLLKRKEELAGQLGADWYIHADADEFRESPWPEMKLSEAIRWVGSLGYNAINFELLNFRPTDDGFIPGSDVRKHLTSWEPGDWFDATQIKAWKNLGQPIELAKSGGHEVQFPGRRVCPVPFLLRHYPIRGETHGRQKLFKERFPRFAPEERAAGWHVQYDSFLNGKRHLLRAPSTLIPYDPHAVRAQILSRILNQVLLLAALHGPEWMSSPLNGPAVSAWLGSMLGVTPVPLAEVQKADEALNALLLEGAKTGRQGDIPKDAGDVSLLRALAKIKAAVADLKGDHLLAKRWADLLAQMRAPESVKTVSRMDHRKGASQPAYEEVEELILQGKAEEAIEKIERLLDSHPHHSRAHNDLGVLYFQRGDKERALDHFIQSLEADPQNTDALKNLADLSLEMGHLDEAIQFYRKILVAQPKDVDALLGVGNYCVRTGKIEEAQGFFKKVLEFEPENTLAKTHLETLENLPIDAPVLVPAEDADSLPIMEEKSLKLEERYGRKKVEERGSPDSLQTRLESVFQDLKKTPQEKLVSIIILVHNQLAYTQKCLERIFIHTDTPFELILVDNGSTDGTGDYLKGVKEGNIEVGGWRLTVGEDDKMVWKKEAPKEEKRKAIEHRRKKRTERRNEKREPACQSFKVIQNETNQGFALGNNQGIRAAKGDYLLLLNNDVAVTPGWLSRMKACAEKEPQIGIVGPMSNYVSGPQQVKDVSYDTRTLEGLDRFAHTFAQRHAGDAQPFWRVVGFCMLIKRAVVEKIGGLDGRFGLGNFEDDDFSLRSRLAGFESRIAKDCFVHHFGNRTFIGSQIDFAESLKKNWELFKKKWGVPSSVAYGEFYDLSQLLKEGFIPERHYCLLSPMEDLSKRGEELFAQGDLDGAKKTFEEILMVNPDEREALNDMGVLAYHQENPDLAADYFTRALKVDPTYMEAMVNLGNCLMKQKEFTQATQCFKKALDRNPHDVSLLNDLANCFIQLEDFPEAEKIYERSYQLDGNQRQVGEALAALKKMKGLGISREAAL